MTHLELGIPDLTTKHSYLVWTVRAITQLFFVMRATPIFTQPISCVHETYSAGSKSCCSLYIMILTQRRQIVYKSAKSKQCLFVYVFCLVPPLSSCFVENRKCAYISETITETYHYFCS